MNILIVEDNECRMGSMQRELIGHTITIARTAKEAILLLDSHKWDAISLDHDLGDQETQGTGYEVAQWLSVHPDKRPPSIFIHSLNPVGRMNIARCLPSAINNPNWWKLTK